MHAWIAGTLEALEFGKAVGCGDVVVVPLLAPEEGVGKPSYRAMPEAMARGDLLVTEVTPAGEMGLVQVRNRGDQPVLILEGEEWSGGKQNRVVTTSCMLRRGADFCVPVACSEPARWHYHGSGMGPALGDSGAVLPVGLRREIRLARKHDAAGEIDPKSVQAALWQGLEAWRGRIGTGCTLQEWHGQESQRREGAGQPIAWVPRQMGWLVSVQGKWVAMELVASPATWRRWHGKMLRGVLASWPQEGVGEVGPALSRPWARPAAAKAEGDGKRPCQAGERWARRGSGAGPGRPELAKADEWDRLDEMPSSAVGTEEWRWRAKAALREWAGVTGREGRSIDDGQLEEHASPKWVGAALMRGGEILHGGWQRVRAAAVPRRAKGPDAELGRDDSVGREVMAR